MTTYHLERVSDVDLVFDGELLSETSTDEGGDRWTEVRVYRTVSDRWVVERTGQSRLEGEVPLVRATACDTPADVRRAITSTHRDNPSRYYVTDVAYEAVRLAAEADPRLTEAIEERV